MLNQRARWALGGFASPRLLPSPVWSLALGRGNNATVCSPAPWRRKRERFKVKLKIHLRVTNSRNGVVCPFAKSVSTLWFLMC